MFKSRFFAAALGLSVGFSGGTSRAQEGRTGDQARPVASPEPGRLALAPVPTPASVPSQNQRTADAIADYLQRSGRLRGYHVNIRCSEGAVELAGRVANAAQRTEVVLLVQALPGVEKVSDKLEVTGGGTVLTTQGPDMEHGAVPDGIVPEGPLHGHAHGPFFPTSRGLSRLTTDIPQEPMSIMEGNAPLPGHPSMQPPPMPPNAWPAYAPYNNYSRVGYPTLYPYQAFPFIGPMYPFPKVPLGWRAVTLQWQDGYWWYGRKATGHDWWRIRYY